MRRRVRPQGASGGGGGQLRCLPQELPAALRQGRRRVPQPLPPQGAPAEVGGCGPGGQLARPRHTLPAPGAAEHGADRLRGDLPRRPLPPPPPLPPHKMHACSAPDDTCRLPASPPRRLPAAVRACGAAVPLRRRRGLRGRVPAVCRRVRLRPAVCCRRGLRLQRRRVPAPLLRQMRWRQDQVWARQHSRHREKGPGGGEAGERRLGPPCRC